jgi:hypothetical protein
MSDPSDLYIRRALKNWAARQRPLPNSRARLLLVAAAPPQPSTPQDAAENRIYLDIFKSMEGPSDRAIELYDLSWLLSAQFSLARLGRVT